MRFDQCSVPGRVFAGLPSAPLGQPNRLGIRSAIRYQKVPFFVIGNNRSFPTCIDEIPAPFPHEPLDGGGRTGLTRLGTSGTGRYACASQRLYLP